MGLDQPSVVHINELEGFDDALNVFEHLCIKDNWGKVKRAGVPDQGDDLKTKLGRLSMPLTK